MTYTMSVLVGGALFLLVGALVHLVGQAFRSEHLLLMHLRHDKLFLMERRGDEGYVILHWPLLPLALARFAGITLSALARRLRQPVPGLHLAHRAGGGKRAAHV